MSSVKYAIVGLHGEDPGADLARSILSAQLESFGYEVVSCMDKGCFDDNLERIGIPDSESKHSLLILMDMNFPVPAGKNIEYGAKIYESVQESVNACYTKFIAISGTDPVVRSANKAGIVCHNKERFNLEEHL